MRGTIMNKEEIILRFERVQDEFRVLTDKTPELAVKKARDPNTWKDLGKTNAEILKSGILIDAGYHCSDQVAISEGVQILRDLIQRFPEQYGLYQNLGNGLVASSVDKGAKTPEWHLRTFSIRQEARRHFLYSGSKCQESEAKGTAFNNLGNALNVANRWVEAYDQYMCALEHDPTNAVASTGAVKILLRAIERGIGDKERLNPVVARLIKMSRLNEHRIRELAGEQAHQGLQGLLSNEVPDSNKNIKKLSKYERFVKENRLNLSLTIEGEDFSIRRWDSLGIRTVTVPVKSEPGTPPIFAMFNVLKADYLLARRLVFDSKYKKIPETTTYSDTLDYANYGAEESMLILCQRMCLDILDKIAVAATEYFGLSEKIQSINFENRWFVVDAKTKGLKWNDALKSHIQNGNWAIIALAEIALDLKGLGFLHQKRQFRNAGTHRFLILHELDFRPSRHSDYIEHSLHSDFYGATVESLRLVRAALIHFVEMIGINENRRKKNEKTLPIDIPRYHKIRGTVDRRRKKKPRYKK